MEKANRQKSLPKKSISSVVSPPLARKSVAKVNSVVPSIPLPSKPAPLKPKSNPIAVLNNNNNLKQKPASLIAPVNNSIVHQIPSNSSVQQALVRPSLSVVQQLPNQAPRRQMMNGSGFCYEISKSMQEESLVDPKFQSEFRKEDSKYDLEKGLTFEIKTLHKHIKLTGEEMTIPIMASVKTLDSTEQKVEEALESAKQVDEEASRPTLDLVCVIDNSGSMGGQKIENVKKTLCQLIEMLNSEDRLSLILFNSYAKTLCNLKKLNDENKQEIIQIVNSISSTGGTDIFSGMQQAFEVLQNRKTSNQVSSIFLLSDGQDGDSDKKISNYLNKNAINKACFTIHSFGFGSDHDGPLMNRICNIRDGNFYFIENITQVDEFFVDALGGLFSVIAQEVQITVSLNATSDPFNKFFKGSRISKTYGNMWKVVKEGIEYNIVIKQLFSGISKDFIFEVNVPKGDPVEQLQDFERNIELIQGQLTAIPVDIKYSTRIMKESHLMLTLYSNQEQVAEDSEINDNVEFNYLRVKAASAMEEAIVCAEQSQFDQGQAVLETFLKRIENAHPKNKEKLMVLKKDVEDCQESAKPQVYQHVGKFKMLSKKEANFKQSSQAIGDDDLFQNKVQKKMVMHQKKCK